MTKHSCDKCGKECNRRFFVRMAVNKEEPCGKHKLYKFCKECYWKIFVAKEGDGE